MLRPGSAAFSVLVANDVRFTAVAAPLSASTPTPTPTASPTATATPSAASSAAGLVSLIRITELMPDPPEEGRDADFEWVELTNVGTVEVSLDGYVLRDNSGEVALPNFSLPPGAVLVIAAPLARVRGAVAYRLSSAIGNGWRTVATASHCSRPMG